MRGNTVPKQNPVKSVNVESSSSSEKGGREPSGGQQGQSADMRSSRPIRASGLNPDIPDEYVTAAGRRYKFKWIFSAKTPSPDQIKTIIALFVKKLIRITFEGHVYKFGTNFGNLFKL